MNGADYHDRTNAPIKCPLKKSEIAWARCREYRKTYQCLCKEARDRLRIKGQGSEAFEEKLRQLRRSVPARPPGWTVERMTRFYVIRDEEGRRVHRTTNRKECDHYLKLAARAQALEMENRGLWALLEAELIDRDDPWEELEGYLSEESEEEEFA